MKSSYSTSGVSLLVCLIAIERNDFAGKTLGWCRRGLHDEHMLLLLREIRNHTVHDTEIPYGNQSADQWCSGIDIVHVRFRYQGTSVLTRTG